MFMYNLNISKVWFNAKLKFKDFGSIAKYKLSFK